MRPKRIATPMAITGRRAARNCRDRAAGLAAGFAGRAGGPPGIVARLAGRVAGFVVGRDAGGLPGPAAGAVAGMAVLWRIPVTWAATRPSSADISIKVAR